MSTDEQLKEIGRLIVQRTEAKREAALIHRRLQETGKALSEIARLLMPEYPNLPELEKARGMLDPAGVTGGSERIRIDISEYLELASRIAGISRSLKDAGAE